MRILALLPTLTPPAYLTGLAAAGHEVHLVTTLPTPEPRRHLSGVAVWSLGYWWKAAQGTRPQVALSETGDRQAANLIRRAGRIPHLRIPSGTAPDPLDLEAALLARIPQTLRARARATALMDPLTGSRTRVVAWMHYGVPYRRAGSETMLQTMLRALQDAGMGVLAVTSEMPEAPDTWEVDGVRYMQLPHGSAEMLVRRAKPNVLVTHHHLAPHAISVGKDVGARTVLVKHNDHRAQAQFLWSGPDLVVYNTDWVRESLRRDWLEVDRIPNLTVHPPVQPDEHHTADTGDAVTLVNLSANKGVGTWRAAAQLLPRLPFLGVTGAHGAQETGGLPPNARVIPQTSDMRRDVWARTRVLLMPSVYESYGMAAVEALASGIPVIAHPTPGLREALGGSATFIDREDHRAWAEAVSGLHSDSARRDAARRAALDRSAYLADQTRMELKRWAEAVQELARR